MRQNSEASAISLNSGEFSYRDQGHYLFPATVDGEPDLGI
jgi:hypothetical protein